MKRLVIVLALCAAAAAACVRDVDLTPHPPDAATPDAIVGVPPDGVVNADAQFIDAATDAQ